MSIRNSTRLLALNAVIYIFVGTGCSLPPDAFIDIFFTAAKNHNIERLSAMSTPSFAAQFSHIPNAKEGYMFGIKDIQWDVHDLYTTPDGMTAVVRVNIAKEWPPPSLAHSTFYIYLIETNQKWYVDGINVSMDNYVELYSTPQEKTHKYLATLSRPRWPRKTIIDEPLAQFAQRYDMYVKDWQQ